MMMKNYAPDVCAMKECAYPHQSCSACISNKSLRGKQAFVVKDPKGQYSWLRKIAGH